MAYTKENFDALLVVLRNLFNEFRNESNLDEGQVNAMQKAFEAIAQAEVRENG